MRAFLHEYIFNGVDFGLVLINDLAEAAAKAPGGKILKGVQKLKAHADFLLKKIQSQISL